MITNDKLSSFMPVAAKNMQSILVVSLIPGRIPVWTQQKIILEIFYDFMLNFQCYFKNYLWYRQTSSRKVPCINGLNSENNLIIICVSKVVPLYECLEILCIGQLCSLCMFVSLLG